MPKIYASVTYDMIIDVDELVGQYNDKTKENDTEDVSHLTSEELVEKLKDYADKDIEFYWNMDEPLKDDIDVLMSHCGDYRPEKEGRKLHDMTDMESWFRNCVVDRSK